LNYEALRAVFRRANALLGTNWVDARPATRPRCGWPVTTGCRCATCRSSSGTFISLPNTRRRDSSSAASDRAGYRSRSSVRRPAGHGPFLRYLGSGRNFIG